MSSIGWVDDTDTMDVRSDTADLMSYIMCCDVLKNECDVIQRRSDVMNRVFVVSQNMICDPMDGSPPGSSAQGISQARELEWVAIPFSWESS